MTTGDDDNVVVGIDPGTDDGSTFTFYSPGPTTPMTLESIMAARNEICALPKPLLSRDESEALAKLLLEIAAERRTEEAG